MHINLFLGLSVAIGIALVFPLSYFHNLQILEEAQATGCPADFVKEHIDKALEAYDKKDAAELKNQLDLAKEVLSTISEEAE